MHTVLEKVNSHFKPDIEESLGFIFKSTAKMDLLLSGLLNLSRLGGSALTIRPVNMNSIILDIIKNSR